MSFTQTGSCPSCGAPIYVPTVWHGVIPPPPHYSCNCARSAAPETGTFLPRTPAPDVTAVPSVWTAPGEWEFDHDSTFKYTGDEYDKDYYVGDPPLPSLDLLPREKDGDAIVKLEKAFSDKGVLKGSTEDRLEAIEDALYDLTAAMAKLALNVEKLSDAPSKRASKKQTARKRMKGNPNILKD